MVCAAAGGGSVGLALVGRPCAPEAFAGLVARAPPRAAPAVRELVRLASAAGAIADAAVAGGSGLGPGAGGGATSSEEAAGTTAGAAPAGSGTVVAALSEAKGQNPGSRCGGGKAAEEEPSTSQMAELDDILAAMATAGAL